MPVVPLASASVEGSNLKKFFNKLSGQPESYTHKSNYVFGKTLGAGTFGVVRQARSVSTKEDVAVKIVLKKVLKGNEKAFYEELTLLQKCHHPNIVGFINWFESKDKFYIVTQLATGGELFDRIVAEGKFTEKDATKVIQQVLSAVDYLHNKLNIVHRDLKPENLLYVSEDEDSPLVLADFGIAKELLTPDQLLTSAAGSLGYCAPEVLTGAGHGKACDIWSLGVITYTLLAGYSPFRAENPHDFLLEVQSNHPVIFHREHWKNISSSAKDFITKAVTVDQASRATTKELLQHEWLVGDADQFVNEDLIPQIKKFNARHKFKQAVEIVKLNNRIKKLREIELGLYGDDYNDSDFALVETPTSDSSRASGSGKSFDMSSLTSALASGGSRSAKSDLKANIFQQVVMAATLNKEKVLNYSEKQSSDKKE